MRYRDLRGALGASVAIYAVAVAAPAMAQTKSFDVPAQSAATGIPALATQADVQILVSEEAVRGKTIRAIKGSMTVDQAIRRVAVDAGLRIVSSDGRTWALAPANAGNAATPAAADDGYRGEEIIVTAQKRVESAQDVPIAISAFSEKMLEEQKIEGGFDLLKAIPNVTFSKSNFTSYNFSIRGVGTKAVSATTDPGVAVAFNNSTLIHNRLFEQEYLDVERVEVLRGPQGTLYGRNATSGVINIISRRPKLGVFEGSIKGEVGNFDTRRMSATLNVPLVDDVLAVRLAGSMTARDGFDYNSTTKNRVNGRDLWSGRVSARFEPSDNFRANFVWERFSEDDNRSRTGKQLCHRDDGPTHVGSVDLADNVNVFTGVELRRALFGQGCKPGSLYDDAAFGTPNGLSYSFILGTIALKDLVTGIGYLPGVPGFQSLLKPTDPYGGMMQSRNLREIASVRDPAYRAGADLFEINLEYDITPSLTFTSQTVFNNDKSYSFQDYNRFNSLPAFNDTSALVSGSGPSRFAKLAPGGIFCDPQIGCSDTIAGFDISSSNSKQFNQEFRIQSSFEGPFNFSLGGNYTKFRTINEYYVMFNLLTAMSWSPPFYSNPTAVGATWDPSICYAAAYFGSPSGVPVDDPLAECPYVDPNPVESINGEGHNYFRSSNPYKLQSKALFGEAYWNIRDNLKLTAGLRYTQDRKTLRVIPSQTLQGRSLTSGGLISKGYPEEAPIRQKWGEFTGRFGLDWKPNLGFTDETLLYGFYSRGYKAGGANPPQPRFATAAETRQDMLDVGIPEATVDIYTNFFDTLPVLQLTAVEYGPTFKPEFVNAFEIGMKNSLMNGKLSLNLTGFYYDYKDYQVSQIRDRTAVNENFDAETWGLEIESVFAPTSNLKINFNMGYLNTRIANGETSIDIMNRTQGDPNYTLVKPWMQLPSNCVVPTHVVESWANLNAGLQGYWGMCGGLKGLTEAFAGSRVPDPKFGGTRYNPMNYPEINGGAGIRADLGGNELPNAPHWTANFGIQNTWSVSDDWDVTLRGDAYWQGKSWARVYNYAPYDRLRDWTNFNLSLRVDGPEDLTFEAYVKNVFNSTPITDAFLNSDDTGLTTNVFTLDPRIIGFSIAKKF